MKDSHDDVQDLFDDESPEMHNDIEEETNGFDTVEEEDFKDELDEDFDEDELDDDELEEAEPEKEAPRRPRKFRRDFDDDDENDELFTRKNNRGGYSGGQNSYVKYGILAVGVVIVILLIILLFRGKSESPTSDDANASTAAGSFAGEDGTAGAEVPAPTMAKNTNSDVVELMNSFYTARQTADLSAMTNLVDTTTNLSAQKLEKMTEYIESYTGITCYTKDGLKAGEYLVYVYCDVKFLNIDTVAPDLQWYYVKTAEDGHLYICTGLTEEENAFAQEQGAKEEVRALVQDVNDRLAAAMASDEGLNNLVKILNGEEADPETPAASDNPEAGDTTAAPEETNAPETTAEPPSTAAASSDSITVWAMDGPYAIRKEPSKDSEQIGSIYKGDHASRTELGSEWSKIEYVNAEGETIVGYVLNDALTTTSPE